MIPSFEKSGLLPVGIHWSTWDEIEKRYGMNQHRIHLLVGLRRGLHVLSRAGCKSVYLDGSFVAAKEFPRDYDACWDTTGVRAVLLDPVLLDFSNLRAAQKAKFFGEWFPAQASAESMKPFRRFLEFFQTDKDTGNPKGIVGLEMRGFQ